MKNLTASSAKLLVFLENQNLRDNYSTSLRCQCPTRNGLSRSEIGFLGYLNKHLNFGFSSSSSLSVSSHRKSVQPIETCAATEEIHTKEMTQVKTVYVKFQLQKECSFGQQFFIVGDDPMFGLWDPSNAIPLDWSEGHVWTVQMDVPCNKVMMYKFILKRGDDSILWQPGPDRILQTWETEKTITVCEDWDNAEVQTIIEEDPVTHQATESKDISEELIFTENLLQPVEEPEELTSRNGCAQPMEKPLSVKPMAIAAEDINEQDGEKSVEDTNEQDGEKSVELDVFSSASFLSNPNEIVTSGINDYQKSVSSGSNETLTVSKDEKNLESGVPIPVLVPGLTPIPTAEMEEASVSEADKHISYGSSLGSYEGQEFNVPELNLKEEPENQVPFHEAEIETTLLDDELEVHDKEHTQKPQLSEERDRPNDIPAEESALESVIQWGRRTLQQFLMNLGFL